MNNYKIIYSDRGFEEEYIVEDVDTILTAIARFCKNCGYYEILSVTKIY